MSYPLYNFEVEDFHSYFVGEFGVLVHNSYEAAGDSGNGGSEATKGAGKTVDDIINGATETTNKKGVARNFEKSGGFEQTLNDFENLNPTNVDDIQTKYGSGKVGTLSDGSRVVARQGSKTDGATLEITVSNRKVYKIRY